MKKERITLDIALEKVESLVQELREFDRNISDVTEKNMESLRELVARIWQNAYNQGVVDATQGNFDYYDEEDIIE